MSYKPLQRDPVGSYHRRTIAERRVGTDARCVCGESRPEALLAGSKPMMCAACDRRKRGQSMEDLHHPAGKKNSPVVIPVWVSDHHAILSPAQYDWPKETRENPNDSPLLAGAACVRGFVDTIGYLLIHLLLWVADLLEVLDAMLQQKWGPKWWVHTDIQQLTPRSKRYDTE